MLQFDPSQLDSLTHRLSSNLMVAPQQVMDSRMQQLAAKKLAEQQSALQKALQSISQAAPSVGGFSINPGGSSAAPSSLAKPKGNLGQWIKMALTISGHRGEHLRRGLYNMIMHESGGNPNAVNNWDSNAAAGTPSIGLMQTIQPTFDAYAMKGHTNVYNPVDNIIAGLRYALSRYGADMVRAGGRRDSNGNYIGY